MHENHAARGWDSWNDWMSGSLMDLTFRHATIPRPWCLERPIRSTVLMLLLA
jgi:hypothetical protein